jgi:hypothetical protein
MLQQSNLIQITINSQGRKGQHRPNLQDHDIIWFNKSLQEQ